MNWHKDLINYFKARRKETTPKVSVLIWENIPSEFLDKQLHVDVYLPPKGSYHLFKSPGLLILNDGQDLKTMNFTKILEDLYASKSIPPIYVAAVHADQDRMYDYGIAHQADYKNRGNKANEYTQFVTKELLPRIRNQFKINMPAAIAGFSLGGLSAFDICWNQSKLFNKVGVFSGALWWRSEDFDPKDPDANRIAHDMVAATKHRKDYSFGFKQALRTKHLTETTMVLSMLLMIH